MKIKYIVNKNFENIKFILKSELKCSSRLITKLNKNKLIYLNGLPCSLSHNVTIGDVIVLDLDYEEDNSNIVPTKMPLDIVYEDDCLLIVNKPPFLAIHPTTYHYNDTLSNGIKYYFDKINLHKKIRPITRLDRNTSGLVVFAKNEYIQENLITQMKKGIFVKKYLGIVSGKFDNPSGEINFPIARKENSIIERCVDKNGTNAITDYITIKTFSNYSLVEFTLKTGRTHQIRVHSSFLGHPLLGDDLYGGNLDLINRQALHCYKLNFIHPITQKDINIKISLPLDMKKLIEK